MNDQPVLRRTLGIDERGGLPAWTYTSPELLDVEKDTLFRRMWQCVCHVSDVPNPGDYLTLDIIGERALIVRGKDGLVRAFHNVCRHRGSRVVAGEQRSCKSAIVCPFHGWSYNLDGSLRAVPLPRSFPPLNPRKHGLPPLEHEIWNGFVFVRFQPGPQPPVHEWLTRIAPELAAYRLDAVEPVRPISTSMIAANWKSVRDVDNEGYHVPMAHPALHDLYGGRYEEQNLGMGISRATGTMREGEGKLWSVRHYKQLLPQREDLPVSKRQAWLYFGFFPNTVLMLYPDSVGFYQEFPVGVDRTLQRLASYGLPDSSRVMKLTRYLSGRIDRDTGREDSQLIVWSCEATKSSAYTDVILSDFESGVRDYHDYLRGLIPVVNLPSAPATGTLAAVNHSMLSERSPIAWT